MTATVVLQTPEQLAVLRERMRPLLRELVTFRRELPRLLEEGEAGRFAVVQGDRIHGTWDTHRDATQYGYERFGVDTPFLAQKIDARLAEPLDRFLAEEGGPCPS